MSPASVTDLNLLACAIESKDARVCQGMLFIEDQEDPFLEQFFHWWNSNNARDPVGYDDTIVPAMKGRQLK